MASMQEQLRDAVAAALGAIAAEATEDRFGFWRVRCADGFQLTAILDDDWLQLRAPFAQDHLHGQAIPRCAWEVLLRNSLLPGAAKLVKAADRPAICATVELPLDIEATGDASDNALQAQLSLSIDDLRQATRRHPIRDHRAAPRSGASEVPDLPALCTAAGWPFNRRSEGRIAVQLEASDCYAQAILAWDDGLRASVNLHRAEQSFSPSARQAIALMLLQLGGTVRAVRPAVDSESGHEIPVLQAYLSPNPSPRQLDQILGALSVAAGLCQREVVLLSDEQVSLRYLSVRGCSATGDVPSSPAFV
ncbi:MAG: hypothetical protein ABSH08_00985 [Tepidisphaeraceae bacterium]|jgi:hypothetical protein